GEAAPPAPHTAAATPDIARLAGAVVHAALERWDFRERDRFLELIRRESRRLAPVSEAGGAATGATREAAGRTAEEIARDFLASGLPERLARSEILGRELPILFRGADGTIWVGSCDLVYRDRDGTIVAADYKTDRTEGHAAAAAERYRSQVAVYVEARRRSLPGRPVTGEILFDRAAVIVPLDEPDP